MSQYDSHDIRARLSRIYDPVFSFAKKIEKAAEEILTEFAPDRIDPELLSTFMADLSELENLYDEFLVLVEEVSQGIEYESRTAKDILESLRKAKEFFSDIRIHAESLMGFAKPNIGDVSTLVENIVNQLNDTIKKLRSTLSEDIRHKIEILFKEQSRIEHLFPDERNIEA